jgi:hypothetical protein
MEVFVENGVEEVGIIYRIFVMDSIWVLWLAIPVLFILDMIIQSFFISYDSFLAKLAGFLLLLLIGGILVNLGQ